MKLTKALQRLGITDDKSGFNYLNRTFRKSLKLWSWFVDWDKVFGGVEKIEADIIVWNQLLGTTNFEQDCLKLLEKHPQIVRAIPEMVVREGTSPRKFSVASDISDLTKDDLQFDFGKPALSHEERKNAVSFMQNTGLARLFSKGGVSNLRDYMLGVEAGLNSNGRKNRSGTSMEDVVGAYLHGYCSSHEGTTFISQATSKAISQSFGLDVEELGKDRRFDFAVHKGGKLVLIEVNLYNSSGSKLDSIARSYPELDAQVSDSGHTFVWITDGPGWGKSLSSLRSAHSTMAHLWNIDILYSGALDELLA